MSQRRQLLLFSLAPVLFLLLPARPVCPANSDLENTLVETPKISCEESRIKMSIRTDRPFAGNVYAKGFFHKEVCRVQGNGSGHVANITIPVNADCGMRRRRSANPHGLSLEIDVILMFHRKFLTKNDRAFHVECQYVEMDQRVGNRLDISALPSTELTQTLGHSQTMPKCRYEVLSAETSHQISFAAIGQPIVHKWTCQGAPKEETVNLYCLTVHSCEVDDGQGSVQKLLDDKGCPLDKSLFGPVDYKADLEAVQRSNAFKFADRPTIYFSCQLRLELKAGWKDCKRSTDSCAAGGDGLVGAEHTGATEGGAELQHFSEPPESAESGNDDFSTGGFSSPDFPTPSPAISSSGGFSMSTGTTALPPSGYSGIRTGEKSAAEKGTKAKGGRTQSPPKAPKGRGNIGGESESSTGERGKPEEPPEDEASENVYVERPTLSIIRRTRRTTRAGAITTHAASGRYLRPSTTPTPFPRGEVYATDGRRNCHPNEFGLNTDCAFDPPVADDVPNDGNLAASREEEEEDNAATIQVQQQHPPGRLSLRQRSTTPLEEMEQRLSRKSDVPSGTHSVDIDVSQAVDVLDVVAAQSSDAQSGGGIGLDKLCRQVPPSYTRRTARPQAEPVEPFQQLCISRQLLSSALFLGVLCLLSVLTVFVCCLLTYQHRLRLQRRLPKTSALASQRSRRAVGDKPVLDAYNA